MKKNNFTETELATVMNSFNPEFNVRVNRAGNIDLEHPNRKNPNEHFVLYLTPNNRYLWRRHFAKDYCYPLNMKGRKFEGTVTRHRDRNGRLTYWGYKPYDTTMSEFETVAEAVEYFKNYLTKYYYKNHVNN